MACRSLPDAGDPSSCSDSQLKEAWQDVLYNLSDSNKIKSLCFHLVNEYSNEQRGAMKSITHEKDSLRAAYKLLTLIENYLTNDDEKSITERCEDVICIFRGQELDDLGKQIVKVILAKTESQTSNLVSPMSAMPLADFEGTGVDASVFKGEIREINPLTIEVKYNGHIYEASEKVYKNTSEPRGMVFLANYTFPVGGKSKKEYRRGSEVDEENIKKLFEDMGYIVVVHRNLTRLETKQAIREFKSDDTLRNVDCCFIIIMSHGRDNRSFYTADDLSLEEKEIETLLNNANCEALMGKPKIFIQQYCRGCMHDYGVPRLQNMSAVIESNIETDSASKGLNPVISKDVTQSDMMFVYSTIEGHVSHRDVDKGSWFIEAFCKVLMEHACKEDFEAMLKEVDKLVSKNETNTGSKQGCEIRQVKFNKYLYLNPYDKNMPHSSFDFSAMTDSLHDRHLQYLPYPLSSSQSAHRLYPTGSSPSSSTEHLSYISQGVRSRNHSRPLSGCSLPSSEDLCRPLVPGSVIIHPQVYGGKEKRLSSASEDFRFLGDSHLEESEHMYTFGMDTVDATPPRSHQHQMTISDVPLEPMEFPDEGTEPQSAALYLPTETSPFEDSAAAKDISNPQNENYIRRERLRQSISWEQSNDSSRLKRQLSVDSEREVLHNINRVKSYMMVESNPDSEMVRMVNELNRYVKEKKDKRHKKKKLSLSQ